MLNNILEVIDLILDEKNLQIFFNDFPLDGEGMLIESSNNSVFETLDGLSNLYSSHIKFFVRMPKKKMGYVILDKKIKEMYTKVYDAQNGIFEAFTIERVEPYTLSAFSVDKEAYIVSLDFNIQYRKEF